MTWGLSCFFNLKTAFGPAFSKPWLVPILGTHTPTSKCLTVHLFFVQKLSRTICMRAFPTPLSHRPKILVAASRQYFGHLLLRISSHNNFFCPCNKGMSHLRKRQGLHVESAANLARRLYRSNPTVSWQDSTTYPYHIFFSAQTLGRLCANPAWWWFWATYKLLQHVPFSVYMTQKGGQTGGQPVWTP